MNINQAIELCGYSQKVKKEFVEFLQNNFANDKTKLYLFKRKENNEKLLLMQIQIPSEFKGQIYDISILIYFPRNFPNSPPELYFEKINCVKINPQCTFYVNEENLNIKFDLFFNWENSFKSFLELIEEIKKQFSFSFPIFNMPNGDENEISGDCILPIDSIIEVSFDKNNISNNNNNINQNLINNFNPNPNYNLNKEEFINENNINNNNFIPLNQNENIYDNIIQNNNDNNFNSENNFNEIDNNYDNNIFNPPIDQMQNLNIDNQVPFDISQFSNPYAEHPQVPKIEIDEKKAKMNLIKKIINNVSPKIKNQFSTIGAMTNKLECIQNNMKGKINQLNELENKTNQLNDTVNNLQKDLFNYNLEKPKLIDFNNLSNLDYYLKIPNKDKYIRFAKQNSLEELMLLIKKAFEKKSIDFQTACLLIRNHSRFLFYLKFKDMSFAQNNNINY